MSNIAINTLWGLRKGFESDYAELMVAWDEYSIEGNPEGWDDACADAIESWGDDLADRRYITVTVDHDEVSAAFRTAEVVGTVRAV